MAMILGSTGSEASNYLVKVLYLWLSFLFLWMSLTLGHSISNGMGLIPTSLSKLKFCLEDAFSTLPPPQLF